MLLNITSGELLKVCLFLVGNTRFPLSSGHLLGGPDLLFDLLLSLLRSGWILTDVLVSCLIQCLNVVCRDALLDVLGELSFISILIVLEKTPHVLCNVKTKDVLTVCVSVEFLALSVITGEALI